MKFINFVSSPFLDRMGYVEITRVIVIFVDRLVKKFETEVLVEIKFVLTIRAKFNKVINIIFLFKLDSFIRSQPQ